MKMPHTITLFNKYLVDKKPHYKRTVIKGCLYQVNTATGVSLTGKNPNNTTTVYIPKTANFEGKKFVTPEVYSNNPLVGTFCFGSEDYIGLGEINLGDLSLGEYKQKYGKLYEIDGYTDNDFGTLSNFVVVCK